MTVPEDLVKDFFNRTLINLELYEKLNKQSPDDYPYEVTQLINSFLGLIVFVSEKCREKYKTSAGEAFSEMILSYSNNYTVNFSKEIYEKFEDKINSTYPNDKNAVGFLQHLRNSVSHCRLEMKPDHKNLSEIGSIRFEDQLELNKEKKPYTFNVELSIDDIREIIHLIEKDIKKSG